MEGTGGKILHVNLSSGQIHTEPCAVEDYENFIGGEGVGWRLMAEKSVSKTDPFSEENVIVLNVGALVGTLAPGASKVTSITKYPTIASLDHKYFVGASAGGGSQFGPMMKRSGFDHVVITGKASEPVYLAITDGKVEISSAKHLWGLGTEETSEALKENVGDDAGTLVIGPAGENLVRMALAIVDKTNSLGRGGLGAVMGSKNLKGIVVRGTNPITVHNAERFKKAIDQLIPKIVGWPGREIWNRLGMGAGWSMFKYTQYPGKWSRDYWDSLYGEKTRLQTAKETIACASCLIGCRVGWEVKDGRHRGVGGIGSPYGKSATSGQLLGIKDHRDMVSWVAKANADGIDFYTLTRLIDFVTQSHKDGKLKAVGEEGAYLSRSYEDYRRLHEMIVNREGVGNTLAEGWVGIQERYGIDPQDYWYAGYCKGMDFIYDARAAGLHPLMMTFFTRPRPHHGGCHTLTTGPGRSLEEIRNQVEAWGIEKAAVERIFTPTDYSGKFNVGKYVRYMEDAMMVNNSVGQCSIYTLFGFVFADQMAALYEALTGLKTSAGDLMHKGERIMNLCKYLNVLEGFNREDDQPPRLWSRPMHSPEGTMVTMDYFKEQPITDFQRILDDYYEERGWNLKTGCPSRDKLASLGLTDFLR